MDTRERHYDLDWLKVFAILLFHLFHCAMPFVAEWDWHIKNEETSHLFLELNYFVSKWRMPLLFFISGVGNTYILNNYNSLGYLIQRAKRLLIPLVFGILLVVPPQIFFERKSLGFQSNFIEFYLQMFQSEIYPKGDVSWHHLLLIYFYILYYLFLYFYY